MTDVAPAAHEGVEHEPAPEHPTGAEDPFDPVEPDDPYLLAPAPDPLAPADPEPDPTMAGGVDIPPPPAEPPPGAQPPPGHAELTTAVAALPALPDPTEPEQRSRVRTWRIAQEGRCSLSDHWSMIQRLVLATADVAASHAANPEQEQGKLDQLRRDLGSDGNISAALDAWCAARDATPVDLASLADAAAKLKAAVDPLQKLLTVEGIQGADLQRQTLGETLAGIVAEVASEAQQMLAGERVSRGTSSDVMTYHLAKMTRDQNWTSRVEACRTWRDVGKMTRTAIGVKTLEAPVSKASGKLEIGPLVDRLKAMDDATKARKSAPGDPDYSTRADVLRGYNGVAAELTSLIATVRARQAELAKRGASGGWDPVQARTAGDVLAGVARALRAELAADPLLQDPDLARAARTALDAIGKLAVQTSLEGLVDKAGTDLRKIWSRAKTSELDALKAAKVDLGDLPKMFDAGLGPLLDQWSAEVGKFPKHNRTKVKDLTAQIAEQLQRYRTAINGQLGAQRSSGLVEGLDVVAAAMSRRIRSFDSRGGLFA